MRLLLLIALVGCAGSPQASHDHRGGMVHDFHDATRWAQVFDDPARDAWQKPVEVTGLLAIQPGMVVADLGAGTGYFEPYLSKAVGEGGKVLALDSEPGMVSYLRERAGREGLKNVDAVQVRPDEPGFATGSVDRVLIVDTWHHLPDRTEYARKLAASLRPGGTLTIVDFTQESQLGPPVHDRVTPEQAVSELSAGGLAATIIVETLPEQYVVVGKKR